MDYKLAVPRNIRLDLGTMSGDIDISELIKIEGDYFLKTLSGDIRMRIPHDSSARVRASARTGKIRCNLPLKMEKKTNHELDGILGEGRAKIELISLSGDISLEARDRNLL